MKVAIVEDEKKLADILQEGLESEGYKTEVFYDGVSAEKNILNNFYDVVVLDLMLPQKNGLDICKTLRTAGVMTPILILTAKDTPKDKVEALDSGADDFLTKPFSFDELLARLRALLRRAKTSESENNILKLGDLVIDNEKHKVFRENTEINLTFKEFELLEYLIKNAGKVKTREEIQKHLWSRRDDDFGNVVDVHIRNLRKKIDDKNNHKIIRTVRNVGYTAQE